MIKKDVIFRSALPALSDDVLVSRAEFATRLRVSLATLHRWVADGTIPAPARIGRRAVWHVDVVRQTLRKLTYGREAEGAQVSTMIVRRG